MMATVMSLILYLLLLAVGLLMSTVVSASSSNSNRVLNTNLRPSSATFLLGTTIITALLMAAGWLPAPSYGWLLPSVPLFILWSVMGALCGAVLILVRANQQLILPASVISLLTLGVLLFVFRWSGELNPNLGWGLFAIPPLVAGAFFVYAVAYKRHNYILHILSWLIVVSLVALPHYLMEMDSQEFGRAYASSGVFGKGPATYVLSQVQLTIVYLIGTLLLLVVPLLFDYFRYDRFKGNNKQRRIASA